MGDVRRIQQIPLTHFWPKATETCFDKLVPTCSQLSIIIFSFFQLTAVSSLPMPRSWTFQSSIATSPFAKRQDTTEPRWVIVQKFIRVKKLISLTPNSFLRGMLCVIYINNSMIVHLKLGCTATIFAEKPRFSSIFEQCWIEQLLIDFRVLILYTLCLQDSNFIIFPNFH